MTRSEETRRDFIKAASAAFVSGCVASTARPDASGAAKVLNFSPGMNYRRLGKTEFMISEISLGGHGARGYGEPAVQNRIPVLARAIELGMNYVDTNIGRECDVYGEAMARSATAKRDKWFIGFASSEDKYVPGLEDQLTPAKLMGSIENRLRSYKDRHARHVAKRNQERPTMRPLSACALFLIWLGFAFVPCLAAETFDWYYREGPLRGSLKSDSPLPLYDSNPEHLWNRLFAVFYIRPSELPSRPEYPNDSTKLDEWDRKLRAGKLPPGPVIKRFEGGDTMGFLAWPRTRYYSEPGAFARADKLLEEFITRRAERLIADPLKRAFLQRDLWAVFDHLVGQNIARFGDGDLVRRGGLNRDVYGNEADEVPFDDPVAMDRRGILCRKLAGIIQRLALPQAVIRALPDSYAAAIRSGHFASRHDFDCQSNYLPPGLLTRPDQWVEIDTSSESLPHFKQEGQIDYVAWSIRGRSYYRIFWRFPGGRKAVEEYLKYIREEGVDWEKTARQGHVALKPDARQIPVGTEAAIVQFMIVLDDRLVPVPTRLVESLRVSVYKNVDGTPDPATNTGLGLIGRVYGAQRRLLFDNLKHGGLARAPDDSSTYQVLLSGHNDWGAWGRQQSVVQTCVHCHMYGKEKTGVFSLNSIFCFAPNGGMPGVVIPMGFGDIQPYPRPQRIARWKQRQEDYLRLVEYARADDQGDR